MPKYSLKRRHHRQHNLSALRECSDSLARPTKARIVSDEDIQINDSSKTEGAPTKQQCAPHPRLKRRAPSGHLTDLVPNDDLMPESSFLCLTPKSPENPTSGASSPWGHFVDMLIPASPTEDEDGLSLERTPSSSPQHRFLPFCPEPSVIPTSRKHHPYHLAARPSRRHRRNHSKASHEMDVIIRTRVCSALDEAQDALQSLHV